MATFLLLTAKAHVHSVTHGQLSQLRNPQHTFVKRPVCKAHFILVPGIQGHSRSSLLVPAEIQNGVCAINADVISEMYQDMATENRQIRRLQRPYSGLTTPRQTYRHIILLALSLKFLKK